MKTEQIYHLCMYNSLQSIFSKNDHYHLVVLEVTFREPSSDGGGDTGVQGAKLILYVWVKKAGSYPRYFAVQTYDKRQQMDTTKRDITRLQWEDYNYYKKWWS